jgi:hypothetical protein
LTIARQDTRGRECGSALRNHRVITMETYTPAKEIQGRGVPHFLD